MWTETAKTLHSMHSLSQFWKTPVSVASNEGDVAQNVSKQNCNLFHKQLQLYCKILFLNI